MKYICTSCKRIYNKSELKVDHMSYDVHNMEDLVKYIISKNYSKLLIIIKNCMKIYIAKDWQGPKVFANPPKLSAFTGLWQGHRLSEFDITNSFVEDEIPNGKYIEREIWWSIVNRVEI